MPALVDVALPVGVDKTFTYRLPEELTEEALPGVRVLVPFGAKHSVGVLLGPSTDAPPRGLKSIREVLDPLPLLTVELMELCRWISTYYVAPIGEVLRAAFPNGFRRPGTRIARLVSPPELAGARITQETLPGTGADSGDSGRQRPPTSLRAHAPLGPATCAHLARWFATGRSRWRK